MGCLFILPIMSDLVAQPRSTDFYGRVVDKQELCTQASGFMSEQDVERLIADMLAMQGLRNRFIVVGCPSVSNCLATVDKDKRPVILFNPTFLQRVQKLQFSEKDLPVIGEMDWSTLTILAHEVGHHLNNHITNPLPNATAHDKELEADQTAGFLLYLMGGQLEQGRLAFREASETGSYTHPPRAQRLAALANGFQDAAGRFPRNRGGGKTDPVPVRVVTSASVTISGQVWMTQNLNVDRFRNGDPIPEARTEAEWKRAADLKQPAWCHFQNDPANEPLYGRLYNWYAVNDPRGLAPQGWHVPSDAEWSRLTDAIGGEAQAGNKLKGPSGWMDDPGIVAADRNASGFSGSPGGFRFENGKFLNGAGIMGGWWSATEDGPYSVWNRNLRNDQPGMFRSGKGTYKGDGLSVRCLRD